MTTFLSLFSRLANALFNLEFNQLIFGARNDTSHAFGIDWLISTSSLKIIKEEEWAHLLRVSWEWVGSTSSSLNKCVIWSPSHTKSRLWLTPADPEVESIAEELVCCCCSDCLLGPPIAFVEAVDEELLLLFPVGTEG